MTIESKFPIELLSRPINDPVAYFCHQVVVHPILMNTFQETKQLIRCTQPGRLIFLYGPPGVGKTTLRRMLVKDLIAENLNLISSTPDQMPVAFIEAIPPQVNTFNWSDFYTRALKALNNQFAEYRDVGPNPLDEKLFKPKLGGNSDKLRATFEELLQDRHPRIFILDGMPGLQNFTYRHPQYLFLDTIKFLAESSGVVWLLIGSYDLLELADGDVNIGRLCRSIPFPRYRLEVSSDEAVFRQILYSFEQHLPVSEPADLVKAWEYIYEKSLGCVGVIKDWLTNALTDALQHEERTLNLAYLKKNEPSPNYLLRLFHEIQRGEEFAKKTEAKSEQLTFLLRSDKDRKPPKSKKSSKKEGLNQSDS